MAESGKSGLILRKPSGAIAQLDLLVKTAQKVWVMFLYTYAYTRVEQESPNVSHQRSANFGRDQNIRFHT